jgi:hypothetical protein
MTTMPCTSSLVRVRFSGRDRTDARRIAFQYWAQHRDELGLSLEEFARRCVALGRGETIVFVDRRLEAA